MRDPFFGRTALWRAVKKANPQLTDLEVDAALRRASKQEHNLVVNQGMSLDRARELVRAELFPEDLDPWAGDDEYGPKP
jgi:hypothetical protein